MEAMSYRDMNSSICNQPNSKYVVVVIFLKISSSILNHALHFGTMSELMVYSVTT